MARNGALEADRAQRVGGAFGGADDGRFSGWNVRGTLEEACHAINLDGHSGWPVPVFLALSAYGGQVPGLPDPLSTKAKLPV
jgi:hypothetical protein